MLQVGNVLPRQLIASFQLGQSEVQYFYLIPDSNE